MVSEKTVKIKWLVASEELEQKDERKAMVRKRQWLVTSKSQKEVQVEENLFVYHAHKHRVIRQTDIENENDLLEIDPNLEEAFLHRMCYHASVADKSVGDSTAGYFDGKYNFHYKRAMPRVRQKIRQFKSLWFQGQAIERVRDVNLIGYSDVVGHTGNHYRIL